MRHRDSLTAAERKRRSRARKRGEVVEPAPRIKRADAIREEANRTGVDRTTVYRRRVAGFKRALATSSIRTLIRAALVGFEEDRAPSVAMEVTDTLPAVMHTPTAREKAVATFEARRESSEAAWKKAEAEVLAERKRAGVEHDPAWFAAWFEEMEQEWADANRFHEKRQARWQSYHERIVQAQKIEEGERIRQRKILGPFEVVRGQPLDRLMFLAAARAGARAFRRGEQALTLPLSKGSGFELGYAAWTKGYQEERDRATE